MATPVKRQLKRSGTKKSHSWWWDSHISPKNSKWLAEHLEEMDNNVKRMLKLIEEDADSFAQKAQMYYQKRPELINLVEEFYRMYRSLAERYDNVTGELRKNIPSDLRSQGSGVSDISVELSSISRDRKPRHRKSGPLAVGFDVFLGSAGNSSDVHKKGKDDSSSVTDSGSGSDSDSDDSSVNNYSGLMGNGGDQALTQRITDLEMELRETKERLLMQQEGSLNGENFVDFHEKIVVQEKELEEADERIRASEGEIQTLKIELQSYKSSGMTNGSDVEIQERDLESNGEETEHPNRKMKRLEEELRITKEKLEGAEKEITYLRNDLEINKVAEEKLHNLQDQLELAQRDAAASKTKLNVEKREVLKLQERMAMLKTSLQDRDYEIRDLKIAVSDAEQKIFPEKAQIKAEMSKLVEERSRVEEQLKELESRGRSLEDDIRRVLNEKAEIEERLMGEIEGLKSETAERNGLIEKLNENINVLMVEKDGMCAEIVLLKGEVGMRNDRVGKMEQHLEELHMEHVKQIAGAEEARKLMEQLRARTMELEEEVERQRAMNLEAAEEKREAIRQLCYSLDHYRNRYLSLLKAITGHKGLPVLASRA